MRSGPDAGAWFACSYGREPEGVWFAPGRVNLLGGPDYNEVFVLPFALGTEVSAAASHARYAQVRTVLSAGLASSSPLSTHCSKLPAVTARPASAGSLMAALSRPGTASETVR
jgi:galactokinase